VLRDLDFVVGDLHMIVTGICWALYTVLVKRLPAELDPVVLFLALTAAAAVVLAPFYTVEALIVGVGIALNAATIASLVYVVVFTGIFRSRVPVGRLHRRDGRPRRERTSGGASVRLDLRYRGSGRQHYFLRQPRLLWIASHQRRRDTTFNRVLRC
jgi:hypothetical protein